MLTINELSELAMQRGDDHFPLILTPSSTCSLDETLAWVAEERQALLSRSEQYGAVLFRGFGLNSDHDFDAFIRAFDLPNFTYAESLSNAVRVNRTERVFTANEAPPEVSIDLHHEMAQTPIFPSRLFFYCEHAAESRGQTPLCRSDWLLEEMTVTVPAFVEQCRKHGVRYHNEMPADDDAQSGQGRSWRSTLRVEDVDAAERKLGALGYEWSWLDSGALRATTPVLPAIRSLKSGREVFFNQLIAAFKGWKDAERAICFGDGSPIAAADMEAVIDMASAMTFDTPWQTGDAVLVDNFLVMHGRRPFVGTRRVLASLVADDGSRLAA